MMTQGMYTSNTDLWATPQGFFDELNEEFHFDLDVCANAENHKCERYYTKEQDGLKQEWDGSVFCNPPYGRGIGAWVEKAYGESIRRKHTEKAYGESIRRKPIVMLLPARTDTKWFHNFIYHKAEIRFIKGRLKFGDSKNSAPFPSMVVIYK